MKQYFWCVAWSLTAATTASAELPLRQIELAGRGPVGDAMKNVAAFQMQAYGSNAPTDWKAGTFFSGLAAAYRATGNPDFLRYATDWGNATQWQVSTNGFLHADQICVGQTYLDLYEQSGRTNPVMIAAVQAQLEKLFNRDTIKRSEIRHAVWKEAQRPFNGRNLWWWCDALYMAPPVLARMSVVTGDPKYRELLHQLYWDTTAFLYDQEAHLFYRDESAFKARTPSGKKVFWGRGNGWVYAGLIRTLDHLPAEDPQRAKYLALFREMTQSILAYQQPDGLWRSSLNDPEWFPAPETSGTSFFCYGLLAAINRGYLDKETFLPPALRAWQGLLGCINADGRLGYAQPVASSPGLARPDGFIDYAHGAFLLAASELYKMNPTAAEIQKTSPPPAVAVLAEHAAWTWYNDERAIVTDNQLLVGSLDARTGHAKVNVINLSPGQAQLSGTEQELSSWASRDDHNNPALLKLADGRLLAAYSKHGSEPVWNWRTATAAKDKSGLVAFKWGAENTFAAGAGSTYANLIQLAAETNRLYNFFRAANFNPTLATSDDGAKTWSPPALLIRVDHHRPYVKYADNGRDRIDFLFTDGHPRDQLTNNVYHMYYTAGNFHRSDGALIRSLAEVRAGQPIVPAEATLVYAGSTEGRGWVWDLKYDRQGNPVAAYINVADGAAGNDLRYRYARWDAVAQRWQERQIAFAGAHLYAPENHYAGGIAIDPNDANQVYLATAVEPATGKPGATGRRQIFRGRTADRGATWRWEQLTFDTTVDNLRPFVPRQTTLATCVLWFRGNYQTYEKFDTDIVGLIERRQAEAPEISGAASRPAAPAPATWCRFVPERMDDFAWENDLVAFRAYGPAIKKNKGKEDSGIDCWGKRVKYPIIDKWYAGDQKGVSYHKDHGEGNDFYHVGASRGCGGLGIWQDGKIITAGPYREWKIISRTPEKSVFELTYEYALGDRKIAERKRITIALGERLFRVEATFTENGQPAALDIAVGITTHDGKGKASFDAARGWMACWEKIEDFGFGTGVVIAPARVREMREIKSATPDASHVLLLTRTDAAGAVAYAAGYGWEKAGVITTPAQWEQYLAGLAP